MDKPVTTDDLYGPQPWFARGNRIKDNHGFEVCFMSCNPTHILNECEKRQRSLLTAAPLLLEALKGVVRIANRKTVEFDVARAAIAEAESINV